MNKNQILQREFTKTKIEHNFITSNQWLGRNFPEFSSTLPLPPLFSFAPTADTTLLIYRTCIAATVRYFTCPSNTDFCRHIGHFCNGERLTWVANAPSGVMTLSACDFVTPTLLRLFITKGQFPRVSYDLAVVVVVVVFPYDRCDPSTRFRERL